MSLVVLSPNMNLPVPIVGQDPGPTWASDLNNCLSIVDQHNHSSGSGVPITPSGLNINAELPFNDNNLTTVRSARFFPQSAALSAPSDLGCIYEVGVDLYYNDGNGNIVRITQGGAVTGAAGNISGLVSPASASYSAGSQTFIFQSNVNTPANIDGESFIFRNNIANSKGLTLEAPAAMGTDYAIVLPQPVVATSFLTLDSSGNMGSLTQTNGITGSMIASNTIPLRTALPRAYTTDGSDPGVGGIVSGDIGSFTNSTSGAYLAEGTPITLTTIGKTVEIWIDSDGVEANPNIIISSGGPSKIALFRDGVLLKTGEYNNSTSIFYPPTSFRWVDINAPAGTHVYQLNISASGSTVASQGCVLVAREVP